LTPLNPLPFREVKRKLEAAGFEAFSQRGCHVKFVKSTPIGLLIAVVPRHKEITVGTLRSIIRQAHIQPDEFVNL
jgi:predicted RNA binding protein YcfA (HicA-like mRNA interferase family)